jgi:alginate O-acetyltransferase complex protein AlgI
MNLENIIASLQYLPNQPLIYNSVLFFLLFTVFYLLYSVVFNKVWLRNFFLLLFSYYFYYKISGPAVILLFLYFQAAKKISKKLAFAIIGAD